jgi:hypothetical protein
MEVSPRRAAEGNHSGAGTRSRRFSLRFRRGLRTERFVPAEPAPGTAQAAE